MTAQVPETVQVNRKRYKFRDVLELTFEDGRLLAKTDRSEEMAEIRRREGRGGWDGSENLAKWIDDSFRLDY